MEENVRRHVRDKLQAIVDKEHLRKKSIVKHKEEFDARLEEKVSQSHTRPTEEVSSLD